LTDYWTKLDHSILQSSIWDAPNHVRLVWITMLALSDKDGYVGAAITGVAHESRVTIEEAKNAIEHLSSPDEYSRTKDEDGRRIQKVDRGWLILNYRKYRGETSEERKKRIDRERMRQKRQKATESDSRKRKRQSRESLHTDTDTDTDPDLTDSNESVSIGDLVSSLGSMGSQKDLPLLSAPTSLTSVDRTNIKKSKTKRKKTGPTTDGSRVWDAYARAYEERYNIEPVRNTKQNSLCKRLVERLGASDAVGVAAYYPTVRNAFDCARGHALEILLKDCEKHCTAWKTGQQITMTKAQETDRLAKEGDDWREIIEKHKIKEKMKGQVL
jgi:hypothetical protein